MNLLIQSSIIVKKKPFQLDSRVQTLEKNKAFQDYLKGIDSESIKGKGLKQGDSILEGFEKYVKVKTKDGSLRNPDSSVSEKEIFLPIDKLNGLLTQGMQAPASNQSSLPGMQGMM